MDENGAYNPLNSVLDMKPQDIICPSCNTNGITIVREESSTFSQRMISFFEKCCCCKCSWQCSKDLNHYCSHCGCFIGRYIEVGYFQEKTLKKHQINSKAGRCNRLIELPIERNVNKETAF